MCIIPPPPQRIAAITSMLQQSLEDVLIEGLQTSNLDMVRHCLRTYATIDKTRDAEALVGQVLVKPYMDQVSQLVHTHAPTHTRTQAHRHTGVFPRHSTLNFIPRH